MSYLARLLDVPRREHHVLDLAAEGGVVDVGDAGEAFDVQARDSYRERAAELRAEIEQAEAWNDPGTLERARGELSALEAELGRGLRLGGRARREKQAAERARIAVKRRLDDAIRRIAEAEPLLGDHLRRTVRTGIRCSYVPERAG
jgi:non-specific serine/threonine protein kinase